ncbi:MAG TPA: DNA ligase D, partial [Longimicrobiales bacterium]
PPRERGVHWVEPSLVAQVAFTEWTNDGAIRHPTFRGLREDKPATAVVRESPRGVGAARKDSGRAAGDRRSEAAVQGDAPVSGLERARAWAEGAAPPPRRGTRPKGPQETQLEGVRLSHPERVLFPAEGVTKLDLARYYLAVSEFMVPLIARRPLMLVRCPAGIAQQCFFQKHANDQVPRAVARVDVPEKDGKGSCMYVSSLEGVLALLNLGALELHTWGCREDRVDRPDRLVFDLDPVPSVRWEGVVELALVMKQYLESLGLRSFPKTTGGKGLHIVVPLTRRSSWDEVTAFARGFAQRIADAAPGRYTLNMSKARRKGRIFIDYLRNARGATAVEAYSVRARAGAPVSTPVRWEEVGPKLRPDQWTAVNFEERLRSLKADPWEGYAETKQALTAALLREVGVK